MKSASKIASSPRPAAMVDATESPRPQTRGARRRSRRAMRALILLLLTYALIAYVSLPLIWRWRTNHHPSFDQIPTVTRTSNGIAGDPVNVAIVTTEADLNHIMLEAGWVPADPITFASCIKISAATVLRRMYEKAPVSTLLLFGRKQDLAYQKPVGHDPSRRHHVRFWRSPNDEDGVPVWVGAATYDRSVGLSHTTLQVTHHIDADVDAERDHLLENWRLTGRVRDLLWIDEFQTELEGKNGGGDHYYTDGRLPVAYAINHEPSTVADSGSP
jgi:hypothetical protein